MNNIIRPGFKLNNLIATLEDTLGKAKAGEIAACIIIGVDREGEYTIAGKSGDIEKLPALLMVGELEHQKRLLLDEIED